MSGADTAIPPAAAEAGGGPVRTVAVIDIGTSSVRMAVAQINADGTVTTLDRLQQSVNLGKSTFSQGYIDAADIADCVRILKSFRRVLLDYGVERPEQIRAVATSAVREAANRDAFLDRVYIATGIDVDPVDEAEVNRLTYRCVEPFVTGGDPDSGFATLVAEVGGGSTELLLIKAGNVAFSHSYRLGSLRLRQMLEDYKAPASRMREIMETHINRTVAVVCADVPPVDIGRMIALGGEARFAARQLVAEWDTEQLASVSVAALDDLLETLVQSSVDALIRTYHVTPADAETVVPALTACVALAKAFGLEHLHVAGFNLRDGLLAELADDGLWTDDFKAQISQSARDLAKHYDVDLPRAEHVARICAELFVALADEHQLGPRDAVLLHVAALLHEAGRYVGESGHHKHSMYLIRNSEVFGLGKQEVQLVALVARYHRRAVPKPTHEGYAALGRDARIAVSKMAAILRLADALATSPDRRVQSIDCSREDGVLVIDVPGVDDLSLERLALERKGPMFEQVYGLRVELRAGRRGGRRT